MRKKTLILCKDGFVYRLPPRIFSTPEITDVSWENIDKIGITQKNFEIFTAIDQFPEEDLEELQKTVKNLLLRDTTLAKDDKDKLIGLLGQGEERGLLKSFIDYTKTEKDKQDSTIAYKNILGLLATNWTHAKKLLADRYDDFSHCDVASMRGLIHMQLGLWPEIIQASEGFQSSLEGKGNPSNFAKSRLDSGLKLILQQKRDFQFLRFAQQILTEEIDRRTDFENVLKSVITEVAKQRDAEGLSSIKRFMYSRLINILEFGLGVFVDQKNTHLQNEHFINDYKALFGKKLGLSDCENALSDFNARAASEPHLTRTRKELFRQLGVTDTLLIKKYETEMQAELITAITDLGDQRVFFNQFRDYVYSKARDVGGKWQKEVENEITAIPVPNKSTMNDQEQQQAFDEARRMKPEFVKKYLPLVLQDLGFVVRLGDDNSAVVAL